MQQSPINGEIVLVACNQSVIFCLATHLLMLILVSIVLMVLFVEPASSVYVYHNGKLSHSRPSGEVSTLAWVVTVRENDAEIVNEIAAELGLRCLGQVGQLVGHFLFVHPFYEDGPMISNASSAESHWELFHAVEDSARRKLDNHPSITSSHQQVARRRTRRSLDFKDPMFPNQWHLVNLNDRTQDINVTGVWERNITGRGVTVCVVDDGLEWMNPDIKDNYSPEGSWDLNSNDPNPMPQGNDGSNEHGTRCAGEIAAAPNDFCGVGVAFGARVSGIRALDGSVTDSLEATAFNMHMQINDVYSCSWGPEDNGRTVEGPHHLAQKAMQHGVDVGRGGYGSIYVVASGNGGSVDDNCNFDGYANSIYTVTIGAVTENGLKPFYAEKCPVSLAVTFSSGSQRNWDIVTSDWTKTDGTGCTKHHTGTSAAAPLAAGMIALMLEAQPCLSWRDVQYIIVLTSVKIDGDHFSWIRNAAGLHHSDSHGFGLLNAWRLVTTARVWETVPWLTTYTSPQMVIMKNIPFAPNECLVSLKVSKDELDRYGLYILEYVQARITLSHPYRGHLVIWLLCASGTKSVLATVRPHDNSTDGLKDWAFSTVRCWGEEPHGLWQLGITDTGNQTKEMGKLESWQLILHGTPMTQSEFSKRRRLVEETVTNEAVLDSSIIPPCPLPPRTFDTVDPISQRILKILVWTEIFLFFLAAYCILEYVYYCRGQKRVLSSRLGGIAVTTVEEQTTLQEESVQLLQDTEGHALDCVESTSLQTLSSAIVEQTELCKNS